MILLIDTATEQASVALSEGGRVLFLEENPLIKEQAAWLHPAIQRLLESAELPVTQLQAVAVSAGPGSYTGLRVGISAAKGLCFALKIPLILINTLELMAEAMIAVAREKKAFICPMIDARREEVFTALYSSEMKEILTPQAMILDKTSFEEFLSTECIIFCGSGAEKWEKVSSSDRAFFIPQINVIDVFAKISGCYFDIGKWADIRYAEPVYLKEFYTHAKN